MALALRVRGVPFVLASAYERVDLLAPALAGVPNVGKPTDVRRLLAALARSAAPRSSAPEAGPPGALPIYAKGERGRRDRRGGPGARTGMIRPSDGPPMSSSSTGACASGPAARQSRLVSAM